MAQGTPNERKTVGFRVTQSKEDEFISTLRKAQAEGIVDPQASKSDALRMLVDSFIEDPEILEDTEFRP